jgi:hypothetical protein
VTRQKAAALAASALPERRHAVLLVFFRVAWAGRIGHLGQDRKEGILLLQLALLHRIELWPWRVPAAHLSVRHGRAVPASVRPARPGGGLAAAWRLGDPIPSSIGAASARWACCCWPNWLLVSPSEATATLFHFE